MSNEVLLAIIGVLGTLIGTITGFFLQFIYKHFDQIKERNIKLGNLLLKIYLEKLINNFDVHLFELRTFLIENAEILKLEEYNTFFNKWLQTITVVSADFRGGSNIWSNVKIDELKNDIYNLPDLKILSLKKINR